MSLSHGLPLTCEDRIVTPNQTGSSATSFTTKGILIPLFQSECAFLMFTEYEDKMSKNRPLPFLPCLPIFCYGLERMLMHTNHTLDILSHMCLIRDGRFQRIKSQRRRQVCLSALQPPNSSPATPPFCSVNLLRVPRN